MPSLKDRLARIEQAMDSRQARRIVVRVRADAPMKADELDAFLISEGHAPSGDEDMVVILRTFFPPSPEALPRIISVGSYTP